MDAPIALNPPIPEKGLLDRALTVLAPVQAGEGTGALLLATNVFLLLFSYYILKTVREALILNEAGAEVKAYSGAAQALLFIFLVPVYGAVASRVSRMRLISWVTVFFITNLLIFAAVGGRGIHVGIAFFLWVGIFNVVVVAQFWAFANDLYTEEQGKRLFAIVGIGSALGAWLGAEAAGYMFAAAGPYRLMLIAAALLGMCIGISQLINWRAARRNELQARASREALQPEGGFRLVFQSRYLLLIALMVVMLNIVRTTGEFMLSKLVVIHADQLVAAGVEQSKQAYIGKFMGSYFAWINVLELFFQLFLVSRILKYLKVRGALFILPSISMGAYCLLAGWPIAAWVRIAKILENSTDYSVQQTAHQALFLPTSREAKYKAKAAIDTFFWRFGDMLQGAVVFIGTSLAFGVQKFAVMNVIFAAVWLGVVALIYREHKRISKQ